MFPNSNLSKLSPKFFCEKCNFKTQRKGQFDTHCLTAKHEILTNPNNNPNINLSESKFTCTCGKKYKHLSTLSTHKRKCLFLKSDHDITQLNEHPSSLVSTNELVAELRQQHQDFKNIITEQSKQIVEQNRHIVELIEKSNSNAITTINNNNTNNNKFNLNIFLNEQCKDAMNIHDFVNSIQLQLSDLENMGELGYAGGISKIFIDGLKQLDICKRPIHCSDTKRETLYIKDKDAWEKANQDREMLYWAIKQISHKNVKQIPEWQKENPDYSDIDSNVHERFMKIDCESMGGHDVEEDRLNYNKIIRNVAKEVALERTTKSSGNDTEPPHV